MDRIFRFGSKLRQKHRLDFLSTRHTAVRIPEGASVFYRTSQNSKNVEEFLAGLRFEQKGKLDMVPINETVLVRLHIL